MSETLLRVPLDLPSSTLPLPPQRSKGRWMWPPSSASSPALPSSSSSSILGRPLCACSSRSKIVAVASTFSSRSIEGESPAGVRNGDHHLVGGEEDALVSIELETVSGEEQFDRIVAEAQQLEVPVIVVWMANWCRKCVYLKPKLEKLAAEYHPRSDPLRPCSCCTSTFVEGLPSAPLPICRDLPFAEAHPGCGSATTAAVREGRENRGARSPDPLRMPSPPPRMQLPPHGRRNWLHGLLPFRAGIRFYYVDVNAVPHKLVKRAGVTKMPTIQLWKDSMKQAEVIGGHKAWLVIDDIRRMIEDVP